MRTVYVNGEFVPEQDAKVSIFDRAFLFADAVYEVTSVLDGKLVDFDNHMKRLQRSMQELNFGPKISEKIFLEFHRELVRLNKVLKYHETTVYIEEALHRLVEIHYKLGNIPAARKYASILGYNYNDSDWYKKSYNIVENKNLPIEKEKQKKSLKEKLKKIIKLQ